MKNKRFLLLGSLIVVGTAAWLFLHRFSPLAALNNPESLVLYSIRGDAFRFTRNVKFEEEFHRYPVLGKVEIKDPQIRQALCSALKHGVKSASGDVHGCFWPRHALRVVFNGRTVDYLICFECERVHVFEGSSATDMPVNTSSQPVFDQSLRDAGLKLGKDVPPDRQ